MTVVRCEGRQYIAKAVEADWIAGAPRARQPAPKRLALGASPARSATGIGASNSDVSRILWLSHFVPYPPKGGLLQRSHNLLREVAEGHEVDLVAFNQHDLIGPLFESVEAGTREARQRLGELCRRIQILDAPTDRCGGGKRWVALKSLVTRYPYTVNWLQDPAYAQVVDTWCRDTQYDVVWVDTISLVPYLDQVPPGPVLLLDHHNVESHMLRRRAELEANPAKRWYYAQEGRRLEQLERQWCPRFDRNLMCSQTDAERLRGIVDCRTAIVPNGVDVEFFDAPDGAGTGRSIIFVGTLGWYPNVDAVTWLGNELWPRLKQRLPDLRCDIVGANPPAAIVELGARLQDFVVHGFVDDVRSVIEQAGVYVCPIRDGGGTKLKILDALAMRKALVAHPIACEGIDVTDRKDVWLAETPAEYCEAIETLLADADLRRTLGDNGRRLVESRYAYSVVGAQLRDMIDGLTGAGITAATI